jgi:lipoprotein-releasing system ATP-binding protein
MKGQTLLSAKNLKKTFFSHEPLEIIKGVSLDISEGESLAIIGKSGSGKSTLLNILGTLESPSSGDLFFQEQKIIAPDIAPLRNIHFGFIFQSFHLLEDFTVLDNVLMPAKIARKATYKHSTCYQRALDLLNQVELLPKAFSQTKLLSGGEKQRVCLARALCNNPDIIFADEPTGNLDKYNADKVSSMLFSAVKNEKKSLILVTHDHELAQLCDMTLQLKEGLLHRFTHNSDI